MYICHFIASQVIEQLFGYGSEDRGSGFGWPVPLACLHFSVQGCLRVFMQVSCLNLCHESKANF